MKTNAKIDSVERLVQTVKALRAPGGCPWDREQTHKSLRPYLIEEAYEVLDVLDRIDQDELVKTPEIGNEFRKELGDLLMQVVLHAQLASEQEAFSFYDVADALNEKLIRRHPHVFGTEAEKAKIKGADAAFSNWEKEKAKEKAQAKDKSVLSGLPAELPALQRASRVIEKVTKVGFQWDDMDGPLDKLKEEFQEFLDEAERYKTDPSEVNKKNLEMELGDFIFCVANIAHFIGVQPENALRANLKKFERRFRYVEAKLLEQGKLLSESTLDEMNVFWEEAKAKE